MCASRPLRDISDYLVLLQVNSGHKLAGILLVSHVSDYFILFQVNSGHQLAGILHIYSMSAVSKWACPHTHIKSLSITFVVL